ncbi:hypothetical protein EDB82DRAFT_470949 [Fusarium venenatum]|uniref:uncharacterized protein n=1 Tax=Fusarium venenatum TaxID=56646 RepID=UPI001D445B58|nr:hypothetical protein EDB82DRAFT_470949 [Fusarium venenatum]
MQNTKSSRPGTWGKLVKQHPAFLGRSGPDPDPETFESFVVQNGFDNFSIEEHRLADYQIFNPNSPRSESVATNVVNSKTLKLLRGRGVEVRVGPTPSQDKTWSLSANLISFHSPYLKKAYLWKENNQINLPDHDPAVFGLFVEWMHYGSYDCSAFPKHPSINAKCWILGDYLLCTGFKVYALSCLFKEHVDAAFRISISVEDVRLKVLWVNAEARFTKPWTAELMLTSGQKNDHFTLNSAPAQLVPNSSSRDTPAPM